MQALPDTEWTSADLLGRLERRDRFFVLDVRNRDEFEKSRLEGHSPPPPANVAAFMPAVFRRRLSRLPEHYDEPTI